jgi:hypothetical protein
MKVDAGEKACEAQNVSEAGWAVSSVVALKVAQPGCVVPAFQEADSARCAAALLVPQKADPKPKKNETRTAQLSQ